jgi:B12-binding domain/radical SAM domain protein
MSYADLVLLHAPSVYDFRQKAILCGPVSDQIPSSSVFEMYPIGFASIADYLERAGYRVRIANLAVRMLNNRRFDAGAFIKRLRAPLFGVDLHWLVHAHGAVEVARLVKQHHPRSKVIFGGLSSSYFYRELMQYPEVDYVMRGDSTEEPLRQLMVCLKERMEPASVPNLVWRDSRGTVRENPFSHVPADLGGVMVSHYANVVRSVLRYRDLASYTPFGNWKEYPITAAFTCRGCTESCVICGGSAAAYRQFYNRGEVAFRSPEAVVKDIRQIGRFSRGPIFILGDLRQAGDDYGYQVLKLLQSSGMKNQFMLELFNPAPTEFIRQMGLSCPRFCLEISPESHDPRVRRAAGRHYSSEDLERTLGDALAAGCGRLDVFFMIGLPRQTPQSVMDNVDYCEYLLQKFEGDKRLSLFLAPLSPFLDPASLGFEEPEHYGYHVLFRTLEEHRQALLSPSWKYSLNYETDWLTRHQIVELTYEAMLRLLRLKARYGNIPQKLAEAGEKRLQAAWEMTHHLDELLADGSLEEQLPRLKPALDEINAYPASDRIELQLPMGWLRIRPWRALWSLLSGR